LQFLRFAEFGLFVGFGFFEIARRVATSAVVGKAHLAAFVSAAITAAASKGLVISQLFSVCFLF
jgi:hypothetical protein